MSYLIGFKCPTFIGRKAPFVRPCLLSFSKENKKKYVTHVASFLLLLKHFPRMWSVSAWAGDHRGLETDWVSNERGKGRGYLRPFDGLSALDVYIYLVVKPRQRISELYTVPCATQHTVERENICLFCFCFFTFHLLILNIFNYTKLTSTGSAVC